MKNKITFNINWINLNLNKCITRFQTFYVLIYYFCIS